MEVGNQTSSRHQQELWRDRLTIQLWDRDLIGSNELIGEAEIDLHQHRMLSKAYVRNKNVEMKKRIKGTGEETKRIWFDVYHPEVVDEEGTKITQGKVLMSFEAVPHHLLEKFENGIGRESPNFHPSLPDPVGRFVFDIDKPFEDAKDYYRTQTVLQDLLCYILHYFLGNIGRCWLLCGTKRSWKQIFQHHLVIKFVLLINKWNGKVIIDDLFCSYFLHLAQLLLRIPSLPVSYFFLYHQAQL
jgi:hypothetical protein